MQCLQRARRKPAVVVIARQDSGEARAPPLCLIPTRKFSAISAPSVCVCVIQTPITTKSLVVYGSPDCTQIELSNLAFAIAHRAIVTEDLTSRRCMYLV